MGVEPKANGLKVQCSTTELYTLKKMNSVKNKKKGFEPLTFCSQNRYATKLRYFLIKIKVNKGFWTHDPQNHNLMLYQLSYAHQKWNKRIRTFECPHQKREPCHLAMFQKVYSLKRIWTFDLIVNSHPLYHWAIRDHFWRLILKI